jgi:hypothetical protein
MTKRLIKKIKIYNFPLDENKRQANPNAKQLEG